MTEKAKKIDPCVTALRSLLQSRLGDDFVCLYHYGSRVNGAPEPDSDYDVVCITRKALTRAEKNRLVDKSLDIQFEWNVVFDLHFYTSAEIASAPLAQTPYIWELTRHGVRL